MKASGTQMKYYRVLIGMVGMDDDVRRERLQRLYRVESSADLSRDQMREEITALRRMVDATLPVGATDPAPRSHARRLVPSDPITGPQRALVASMVAEAGISPEGLAKLIMDVLAAWNRWRAAGPICTVEALTVQQAGMVIEALKSLRDKRGSPATTCVGVAPDASVPSR